jgi:hypothetical protein
MLLAKQIDKLIGQAYEMVPDTDRWDDLIGSLAHLVGGDSGIIYIKPSFLRGMGILAEYGVDVSTIPANLPILLRKAVAALCVL